MARQPKPLEQLSPSYRKRIEPRLNEGFSRTQARGHVSKGEMPVSRVRALAERYEIPLRSLIKAPATATIQRYEQQKTYRIVETVKGFDRGKAQRMIDSGGPKYVGTTARIKLKSGKFYQTRTFGTANMGQSFVSGLGSKYGFSDDDIEEVEFFNTEGY